MFLKDTIKISQLDGNAGGGQGVTVGEEEASLNNRKVRTTRPDTLR